MESKRFPYALFFGHLALEKTLKALVVKESGEHAPYSHSLSEISVDSYSQLAVQSLQQDVSNFEELIALVNQYKDDRETLNEQEEIKKVEFDQAKEALFSSFGITDTEYAMYMGENGQAVNAYLEANLDIKQQIDDLSAQVGSSLRGV